MQSPHVRLIEDPSYSSIYTVTIILRLNCTQPYCDLVLFYLLFITFFSKTLLYYYILLIFILYFKFIDSAIRTIDTMYHVHQSFLVDGTYKVKRTANNSVAENYTEAATVVTVQTIFKSTTHCKKEGNSRALYFYFVFVNCLFLVTLYDPNM